MKGVWTFFPTYETSGYQQQRRPFEIGSHSRGPAGGVDFSVSKAAGGGAVRDGCIGFGVVVAFAVTTHSVGLANGFWPIFKVILQLLESTRAPLHSDDFCRQIFCPDHWQAPRTKNDIGTTH